MTLYDRTILKRGRFIHGRYVPSQEEYLEEKFTTADRRGMRPTEVVRTITGVKLGETAKAVKFSIHSISGNALEIPRTEWFPFSQIQKMITDSALNGEPGADSLVVSEWILKEKQLLEENTGEFDD